MLNNTAPDRSRAKVLLIAAAHCINDTFASFLPTFIPYIKETLGLNYAFASALNSVMGIQHIIMQPLIGYMSDRVRRPMFILFGPIMCGLGATLLPNAPTYGLALLCTAVWGIGSAMYHSQGAGGIGYAAKPERLTESLTIYNIGGTLGTMLSPLIAIGLVRSVGYKGVPLAVLPTLLLAVAVIRVMPVLNEGAAKHERKGFFRTFGALFAVLYPLWFIAMIRDLVTQGVRFFLPLQITEHGGDLGEVGTILFLIMLGSSLAMVPAGWLTRRYGAKRLLVTTLTASGCALLCAPFVGGIIRSILYIVGVSLMMATLPSTVSLAQQIVPGDRSVASSIVMGLAWGVSNILMTPAGGIADVFGIRATMIMIGILPFICLPFFLCPVFKKV